MAAEHGLATVFTREITKIDCLKLPMLRGQLDTERLKRSFQSTTYKP